MNPSNINKIQAQVQAEYQIQSRTDFLLFARGLKIASAHGPCLFKPVMSDYQKDSFTALADPLNAVRVGQMPSVRRFWIERTKKAAKDADLAICLVWIMAFSDRPVFCQVCAANRKQASVLRRRVLSLIHLNPWLDDLVEVQQHGFVSRKHREIVRTNIEATDSSGGAHGETPDILVLNELVHTAKWQAMQDHMNNADGVPRGIVIVSTNAGFKGTPAADWRRNAVASPRWKCLIWDKPSPWINAEDVEEAKSRNTPTEYNRLWCGVWSDGSGDSMDPAIIDRAFNPELKALVGPEPGWMYIAAFDLGITHDHAGVVVLGVNQETRRLRVAWLKGYEPDMPVENRTEVNAATVEGDCLWAFKTFGISWFGYDPAAGGSFMAQSLRRRGVPMVQQFFSITRLTEMAIAYKQAMEQGRLECYDDDEGRLRRDFGKMVIVPKLPSGYKLESVSDEHGHADVGTALVITLPKAMEMIGGFGALVGDEFDGWDNDSKLSEAEVEEMPDELREIYELDDVPENRVMIWEDL